MKKGFTLIELIAVITLLAILGILVIPSILNLVKNKQQDLSSASNDILYKATELYLSNHDGYDLINGNVYCISLNELALENLITTPFVDPITRSEIPLDDKVEVSVVNKSYTYNFNHSCTEKYVYKDNSGANTPDLLKNMIPIKYNGTNWIYADIYTNWYDYANKEWANAVVLNSGVTKNVGDVISETEVSLWYVWIPRYKYTIFNGNNESVPEQLIDVVFEENTNTTGTVKCTDNIDGSEECVDKNFNYIKNNSSTYTHPAFTFGKRELTGLWVGKFKISTTDSTCNKTPSSANCNKISIATVKPGVSSFRYANVSNLFYSIQNISEDYEIVDGNTHMIKGSEWGAMAYLKQSKYGLGLTTIAHSSDSNYYTGGGVGNAYKTNVSQSTTGNIYGVYDINDEGLEYVMSNMHDSNNQFYPSNSGFTTAPDEKYYDSYMYDTVSVSHARGKLGDATKEILKTFGDSHGVWSGGTSMFLQSRAAWLLHSSTIDFPGFGFTATTGMAAKAMSSRAVITPN